MGGQVGVLGAQDQGAAEEALGDRGTDGDVHRVALSGLDLLEANREVLGALAALDPGLERRVRRLGLAVVDLVDRAYAGAVNDLSSARLVALEIAAHLGPDVANAAIERIIETLEPTGLVVKAIDVRELAMRNVTASLDAERDGLALLQLGAHAGLLTMCQEGSLYLARSLDLGLE